MADIDAVDHIIKRRCSHGYDSRDCILHEKVSYSFVSKFCRCSTCSSHILPPYFMVCQQFLFQIQVGNKPELHFRCRFLGIRKMRRILLRPFRGPSSAKVSWRIRSRPRNHHWNCLNKASGLCLFTPGYFPRLIFAAARIDVVELGGIGDCGVEYLSVQESACIIDVDGCVRREGRCV